MEERANANAFAQRAVNIKGKGSEKISLTKSHGKNERIIHSSCGIHSGHHRHHPADPTACSFF